MFLTLWNLSSMRAGMFACFYSLSSSPRICDSASFSKWNNYLWNEQTADDRRTEMRLWVEREPAGSARTLGV